MKKLIIVLPIILAAASSIFLLLVIFNISSQETNYSGNLIAPSSAARTLSVSQKGVDLTINNIKRENNQTILELAFNNHAYDLSQLDVKNQSTLAGISPSDYKIINSAVGGHHVLAQLIFPGALTGPLVIKLGNLLTFNFNI